MSQNDAGTCGNGWHKTDTASSGSVRGFAELIKDAHKRVSKAVGYCLTLLDESAMWNLSWVLRVRLSPRERAFLAVAALWSLDESEYEQVIQCMEGS